MNERPLMGIDFVTTEVRNGIESDPPRCQTRVTALSLHLTLIVAG